MPKNFCALPFHHIAVQPHGVYNVCCQHVIPLDRQLNIKTSSPDDWTGSQYVQEVQHYFLQDQRHPGCSSCWDHEDQNFASMRQRVIKEYTILGIDTANPSIKNAEINLGNLCNLKCLMCQEQESSSILAENVRLGINILNQQDLKWNETAHANAKKIIQSQPRVLNIRGGEPFYNKDLLNLVRDIPDQQARQMVLHITTNATIWNNEWQEALSRFRSVRMMFSVDATNELYEYMRFPGSWLETSSNIEQIIKLPNVNGMIHCVVQNLNIARLQDIIDWSMQCGVHLEFDLLWKPNYLEIVNLPPVLKQQAILSVQGLLSKDYPGPIIDFLSKCNTILLESQQQDNTQLWQEFKKQIEPRDHLRGNSYTDFLKDPQ